MVLNLSGFAVICVTIYTQCVISQWQTIWYDDMSSGSGDGWSSMYGTAQWADDSTGCQVNPCHDIKGDDVQPYSYIERSTPTNIAAYGSGSLRIQVSRGSWKGFCSVYSQYDSGTYDLAYEYPPPSNGNYNLDFDRIINLPSPNGYSTLNIQFRTADGSTDSCYWDNVYLQGIPGSLSPSDNPTDNPTANPSLTPSRNPTANPSANPSNPSAAANPTTNPTLSPNNEPSTSPTRNPSTSPSNNPSASPTDDPTVLPTVFPSVNPVTGIPSRSPSQTPTVPPAVSTQNPSKYPTEMPSESPSFVVESTGTESMDIYTISVVFNGPGCKELEGDNECVITEDNIHSILIAHLEDNVRLLGTEIVDNKAVISVAVAINTDLDVDIITSGFEDEYGEVEVSVDPEQDSNKDEDEDEDELESDEWWRDVIVGGICGILLLCLLIFIIICCRKMQKIRKAAVENQAMVEDQVMVPHPIPTTGIITDTTDTIQSNGQIQRGNDDGDTDESDGNQYKEDDNEDMYDTVDNEDNNEDMYDAVETKGATKGTTKGSTLA